MSETSKKLFGTDGVRGCANVHPMTAEVALALGQAIAYVFRGRGQRDVNRILIGNKKVHPLTIKGGDEHMIQLRWNMQ